MKYSHLKTHLSLNLIMILIINYCTNRYSDNGQCVKIIFFSRDGRKIQYYSQICDRQIVDRFVDAFYSEFNVNDETWVEPCAFNMLVFVNTRNSSVEVRIRHGIHQWFDIEVRRVASILEKRLLPLYIPNSEYSDIVLHVLFKLDFTQPRCLREKE